MKHIEFSAFFQQYLDCHKSDVAEWGAFAGYHGRSRDPELERVGKLAAAALARAGLAQAPDRLASAKARLAGAEAARAEIWQRLRDGYYRLIGTKPFSSAHRHRMTIEGVIDLLAFPSLPIVLFLSWPLAAARRWNYFRIEHSEGAVARLGKAAEDYLTLEFDWHFEKGEEARRRAASSGSPATQNGEKEYHHEAATGRNR